jgi:undecaprenyl pyrophosphate phosphatase UppP
MPDLPYQKTLVLGIFNARTVPSSASGLTSVGRLLKGISRRMTIKLSLKLDKSERALFQER